MPCVHGGRVSRQATERISHITCLLRPPYPLPYLAVVQEIGTENAVKAAGKYRQQGKEYLVSTRTEA